MPHKPVANFPPPMPPMPPEIEPQQTPPPVTTEAGKEAVVKSFRDFNFKKAVESAPLVTLPFTFPGIGDTGFTLKIRTQHSAEFREADLKAQRQISALIVAQGGDISKVDAELMADIRMRAFTKLIASWDFPDELNEDNALEFLQTNPTVYDDINNMAATDSLFFSKNAKS